MATACVTPLICFFCVQDPQRMHHLWTAIYGILIIVEALSPSYSYSIYSHIPINYILLFHCIFYMPPYANSGECFKKTAISQCIWSFKYEILAVFI